MKPMLDADCGSLLIDVVSIHHEHFLGVMFSYPEMKPNSFAPKVIPIGFERVVTESSKEV